jgi:long-subunit acyl-CoA synthetase (AMP-forming)
MTPSGWMLLVGTAAVFLVSFANERSQNICRWHLALRNARPDHSPSIKHAHLTVIFATAPHLPALLKLVPSCPCLKMIVSIDELSQEAKSIAGNWAQAQGIELRELRDSERTPSGRAESCLLTAPSVEADGRKDPLEPPRTDPKSVATICYTSVRKRFRAAVGSR